MSQRNSSNTTVKLACVSCISFVFGRKLSNYTKNILISKMLSLSNLILCIFSCQFFTYEQTKLLY